MRPSIRLHYGWLVLAGAFLAYACFATSRYVLSYVLPDMEAELGLAHESMGNIASVYFIAYTVMTFVWGVVADRIGPRKCVLIGQLSIIVGLAGMGFMSSLAAGFVFYSLCGAGAAGQNAPAVRLLSDWFGGARRGLALGIAMTGSGVITGTLGLAVPVVLSRYTWRGAWWLGASLVFAAGVVCWFLLVDTPAKKGLGRIGDSRRDTPASPISARGSTPRVASGTGISSVLGRGAAWGLGSMFFARGIGYVVFTTFAVAYLKELGWGTAAAAGVLATWASFQIPGPVLWGIAADRLGGKYLLAAALAMEAVGLLLFSRGGSLLSYVGAGIIGFSDSGTPTMLASSLGDHFKPATIGTAWGFITLLFGIAAIIGPTLGGALADASGTLLTAIIMAIAALGLASVLALMQKKVRRH